MRTQRSGFERRIQGPLRRGGVRIGLALVLAACGGNAGTNEEPRYPEKRRPATLRSASDGEVMGAGGQSPEDTLEGSATNLHAAPGWEGEKGAMERAKEADCEPETPKAKAESTTATTEGAATDPNASTRKGRPRSKLCPKPAAP